VGQAQPTGRGGFKLAPVPIEGVGNSARGGDEVSRGWLQHLTSRGELGSLGVKSYFLRPADEAFANPALLLRLPGLAVRPGQGCQRRNVARIGVQTLFGQLDDAVGVAEAPLQLQEHILEDVLLLAAAPAHGMDLPDRWLHQALGRGVIAAHEGQFAREEVGPERGPVAAQLAFGELPQVGGLPLGLL
jgi:hypothetical protein